MKFRCFGCNAWGDEMDLLKHFFPGEDFGRRLERAKRLRADYERRVDAEADARSMRTACSNSSLGERGISLLRRLLIEGSIDHDDLLEVTSELNEREMLRRERAAIRRPNSTPGELALRALRWRRFGDRMLNDPAFDEHLMDVAHWAAECCNHDADDGYEPPRPRFEAARNGRAR